MPDAKGNISKLKKHKKSIFSLFGIGIILFFTLLACQHDPETRNTGETMAPDFSLADLDGNSFHLGAERGKMILIIFTTTWCPVCTTFVPIYKEIQETYEKEKKFVMVNIDIEEPYDRVYAFAKTNDISYQILLDNEGKVRKDYKIMGVPSFVLIDPEGKMISSNIEKILDILQTMFGHA